MNRRITQYIDTLDPEKDYEEIAFLLQAYEFPWDLERALEFALFRTFAVPSMSRVLCETGEFTRRPRKRYDDTELILYEISENGFDSDRGRAAIRRMNQMHRRFDIPNEEFLYVLSTFIFEPFRWNARFGWRALTNKEKQASFRFYAVLGAHMNIKNIPEDLDSFEAFNLAYEQKHFQFAETNRRIGCATRDLLLGMYLPRFLWPLAAPLLYALLDDRLREAFGFPSSPGWMRSMAESILRWRGRLVRFLPERKKPYLGTQVKRPTYPEGYEIAELGTFGP